MNAPPQTFFINIVDEPAEWDFAWTALKAHFHAPDFAEYNPAASECWQYMGTRLVADTWEHCFRHRMHPRTNRREYFTVLASDAFHAAHHVPEKTRLPLPVFDPRHCSGAFDGFSVTSDADPGL